MIAVTGPSGSIGRHLVRHLAEAGAPTRALARNPSHVDDQGGRVEVVKADLSDPSTLAPALRGATRLFLLSPGPDVPAQDAALIDAALEAGVRHVVMLSSLGAELGGIAGGGPHMAGEARLRESGLAWTLLHPSEFMTNTLRYRDVIHGAHALFVPSGDGRIGYIDPADIAAVAAVALTSDGHEGRVLRLTGPESLSLADVAATLGEVAGVELRHVDVTDEAFRDSLTTAGLPPPMIEMMSVYYEAVRQGRVDIVTRDVEEIAGRPARSFAAWAREHAAAFRA